MPGSKPIPVSCANGDALRSTIKRMTAGGRFLTRGLAKVRAEAALSVLAYNILRAMNLIGATRLRARIA